MLDSETEDVARTRFMRQLSPLSDDDWGQFVRLTAALQTLGWNHDILSRRLRINESTARKIVRGKMPADLSVVVWLERLARAVAEALERQPALPDGWLTREDVRERALARSIA